MISVSKTSRSFLRSGSSRLAVHLALVLVAVSVDAQNPVEKTPESDTEILNRAELDIERMVSRRFLREDNSAIRVNRELTAILQRNPSSPLRSRIEADLTPVQEFLGKHQLDIADFYLARGHSPRAAEARLLRIVNDYPRFSGMDEVLFKLSTASLQMDSGADARGYLRQLICKYPASAEVRPAFERLNELGFGDWQGCDKLKQ